MHDLQTIINKLRRPRMLIRAARLGAAEFQRSRDLRRLLRVTALPSTGQAVARLLTIEQDLEASRKTAATTYSITKHVEILAALIAESTSLSKAKPTKQT